MNGDAQPDLASSFHALCDSRSVCCLGDCVGIVEMRGGPGATPAPSVCGFEPQCDLLSLRGRIRTCDGPSPHIYQTDATHASAFSVAASSSPYHTHQSPATALRPFSRALCSSVSDIPKRRAKTLPLGMAC